jgi:site-specific DNA-methyltransferase (adenine-specific)
MSSLKLIQGDCLQELKNIPDNSVDLTVTSPPYYVGKEYEDKFKTPDGYKKYIEFLLQLFNDLYCKIKSGGHLWINIDDTHTSLKSIYKKSIVLPTHAILISELAKVYDYKEMILWKKIRTKHATGGSSRLLGSYGRFGSPGSIPIVQECEYILWFKKQGVRSDITDDRRKESRLSSDEFKSFGMQIWDIRPERAKKVGHPAPFPLEIPERIIKLGSFVGDTVLDPFMGSGTTGIVCKNLNRNFIGIELEEKYFKLAESRIHGD